MPTAATKSQLVRVRVAPDFVERFALAAQLDGRTVSDALRCAMGAYVRAVVHNDDDPESGNPRVAETPEKEAPLVVASG